MNRKGALVSFGTSAGIEKQQHVDDDLINFEAYEPGFIEENGAAVRRIFRG